MAHFATFGPQSGRESDWREAREGDRFIRPPGPDGSGDRQEGTPVTEVASRQRAWASLWERAPQPPLTERIVVPLAFVSSAAAAGAHATVGAQHLRDSLLVGTLVAVSALMQLVWAGVLTAHRTRSLLVVGVVGNAAALGLWSLTRTVGPWDVAAGIWQLAVVASCVVLLRSSRTHGAVVSWRQWHRAVHVYVAGSLLLLGALTLTGAVA